LTERPSASEISVTLSRLGRKRRLVLMFEWLTLCPTCARLPVSSHRRDIEKILFKRLHDQASLQEGLIGPSQAGTYTESRKSRQPASILRGPPRLLRWAMPANSHRLDRARMPRQGLLETTSRRALGRAARAGWPWSGGFNKKWRHSRDR